MAILDVDLVGIVWIRIFEALLVFVALVTGGWIRAEASSAGWPARACRVITAIAWAVSIGSVAGFVSRTLWLEIGALLVVLVCFLTSGLIIAAIGEHPVAKERSRNPVASIRPGARSANEGYRRSRKPAVGSHLAPVSLLGVRRFSVGRS